MMNDTRRELDPVTQHLVAVWSMKTAVVWEVATAEDGWYYSTADRHRLSIAASPPPDTLIRPRQRPRDWPQCPGDVTVEGSEGARSGQLELGHSTWRHPAGV